MSAARYRRGRVAESSSNYRPCPGDNNPQNGNSLLKSAWRRFYTQTAASLWPIPHFGKGCRLPFSSVWCFFSDKAGISSLYEEGGRRIFTERHKSHSCQVSPQSEIWLGWAISICKIRAYQKWIVAATSCNLPKVWISIYIMKMLCAFLSSISIQTIRLSGL